MFRPTSLHSGRSIPFVAGFAAWTLILSMAITAPASRAEPTVKDLIAPAPSDAASASDEAARDSRAAKEPEEGATPTLPPGATPRSAVAAFLDACRDGDCQDATRFLEVPRRLRNSASDLARELRVVLDQTLWIDLQELSDAPEGYTDDGLPANQDQVGEVEGANGMVPVLLERSRLDGESIWRFSDATLTKVPALYEQYGYGVLGKYLPSVFFETRALGVELWQWIGLLTLIFVAALVAWLGASLLVTLLRPISRRLRADSELGVELARGPLRLMIGLAAFSALNVLLHLSVQAQAIVSAIEAFALIAAIAWVFLRLADVGSEVLRTRLLRRGQTGVIAILPPGRKTVKALILVVAAIAMLDRLGFNVTALVAGLGVGGIAVALAAQKSLENLFGAFMLYGDRPVRVGDFCRFDDRVGTVEEIGMRSTRVRTLDRTVVSIPNADFAGLPLENYSQRDKIWYHPTLGLLYETTPDQMRFVLVEIRKMLYAHPKVNPEPARVRFVSFGAYSLDLEVFAYVDVTDYGEFLEVAEDLNLRIMDIVAQAGTGFAFPSQTTYLEKGEGVDAELTRAAEQRVGEWRERGTLFLPRFPKEKIEELDGTLDYPPRGAPRRNGADA